MMRRHVAANGVAALAGLALLGLVLAGCSAAHASTQPANSAWHPAHDTAYGAVGAPSAAAPNRADAAGGGSLTRSPSTAPSTPGSPSPSPSPSASGSASPSPELQGKGL